MYRQADGGGAGAGNGASGGSGPEQGAGGPEGVVDVDFEEVDENKKGKSA